MRYKTYGTGEENESFLLLTRSFGSIDEQNFGYGATEFKEFAKFLGGDLGVDVGNSNEAWRWLRWWKHFLIGQSCC